MSELPAKIVFSRNPVESDDSERHVHSSLAQEGDDQPEALRAFADEVVIAVGKLLFAFRLLPLGNLTSHLSEVLWFRLLQHLRHVFVEFESRRERERFRSCVIREVEELAIYLRP